MLPNSAVARTLSAKWRKNAKSISKAAADWYGWSTQSLATWLSIDHIFQSRSSA